MRCSVVIPAYRRPEWLAELLARLAPQLAAHEGSEAIVVDNDPAASARAVAACFPVRYVHEARRGVVHARNRGIAEAAGTHILFIDDDEVPGDGWLAAFAADAARGVAASFGRVVPRFSVAPPPALARMLTGLYSRDLGVASGSEIGVRWAALGTGNSMFDRAACFPGGAPFDPAFNARGGEDIDMIRRLAARGVPLVWNAAAVVEELVPPERMTPAAVARRKFNDGQLRVVTTWGGGGVANAARALAWTSVGAAQIVVHGASYGVLRVARSPRADAEAARVHAGLGKLLWWRAPRNLYAT